MEQNFVTDTLCVAASAATKSYSVNLRAAVRQNERRLRPTDQQITH